jgi:hypothetical protein
MIERAWAGHHVLRASEHEDLPVSRRHEQPDATVRDSLAVGLVYWKSWTVDPGTTSGDGLQQLRRSDRRVRVAFDAWEASEEKQRASHACASGESEPA